MEDFERGKGQILHLSLVSCAVALHMTVPVVHYQAFTV